MKIIQIKERSMIYNFGGKEFLLNSYQRFLVPDFIVKNIIDNKQRNPSILMPDVYEVDDYKKYFEFFDFKKFKKKPANILISRTGGFGDLLLLSTLAWYFKTKYKKIKVFVATLPRYFEILKLFYIDGYFPIVCPISQLKKNKVKYIITFEGIIENERKKNWFDLVSELVNYKFTKPMIKPLPQKYLSKYRQYFKKNNKNTFNLFVHFCAGFGNRAINPFIIADALKELKEKNITKKNINIYFCKANNGEELQKLNKEYGWKFIPTPSILDLIAIILLSDYVLSVDTVIPHICGAYDKAFCGIFGAFKPELRINTYKGASWIAPDKEKVRAFCNKYPCMSHGKCKFDDKYGKCLEKIDRNELIEKIERNLN